MFKTTNALRFLACWLLIVCLPALADTPQEETSAATNQASTYEKPVYQDYDYALYEIQRLILSHNLARAMQRINELDNGDLNAMQVAKKQLLLAHLAIYRHNPKRAMRLLHRIKPNLNLLASNDQITYHLLLAKAYKRSGYTFASIVQRVELQPWLTSPLAQQYNRLQIWYGLQQFNAEQLETLAKRHQTNANLLAWIELATLDQSTHGESDVFLHKLYRWQTEHPSHDANHLLPTNLADASDILLQTPPHHIALLLPLHGKYKGPGQAIRNGFMASYYNKIKDPKAPLTIRVYDTSQTNDIQALYNQAVNNGATFVVGPLQKNHLRTLNHSRLAVPTLALNYLDDARKPAHNLFFYGISPREEAEQSATHAWDDGRRRAIIIAPKGEWGEGIIGAFRNRWLNLGGEVMAIYQYQSQKTLSKDIAALFAISDSKERARQLQRIFGKRVKYSPRRREDFDMIFLIANSRMARFIRPLIKYHYAGTIPIYATSLIYQGPLGHTREKDLNGIHFPDMPWLLSDDYDSARQALTKLWPNTFNHYARLYALGMDAFLVSQSFTRLQAFPHFALNGASGDLLLTHQQIYRVLPWARFERGEVKRG